MPLKESEGIVDVSIKDNINHVSVKVAMAQLGATTIRSSNGYSQSLKRKWCKYCGICFEELPGEVVERYIEKVVKSPKPLKNYYHKNNPVEFISIASGKGGVGKSTVAVNLAVALAREGKKVGLVDADIYGFSVPDMMGIDERPGIDGKEIIPVERHGVKVISMAFL